MKSLLGNSNVGSIAVGPIIAIMFHLSSGLPNSSQELVLWLLANAGFLCILNLKVSVVTEIKFLILIF